MTKREILEEERHLAINLPGLLRERLLSSNGGMCTVDDEAWTLFAVPDAESHVSSRGTFREETARLRAELGVRVPEGIVLGERLVASGYLLLTPKGRLMRWDPLTGEMMPARVDWAPPVPDPRHRRRRVPDAIVAAVEHARAEPGRSTTLKLPGLEPAISVTRTDNGPIASTGGGATLPPAALDALGGTIAPQLMALGWRHQPDTTWEHRWSVRDDSKKIARAIADTFDHAYGLRADMAEVQPAKGR